MSLSRAIASPNPGAALATLLLTSLLAAVTPACKAGGDGSGSAGSEGGSGGSSGSSVSGSSGGGAGSGGASGGSAGSGGTSGTAGAGGGATGGGGGGASATGGDTGGAGTGGGGSGSAAGGAGGGVDAPVSSMPDALKMPDAPTNSDAYGGILAEGYEFPDKPVVRLCKREWTAAQCCDFLCRCLSSICADSGKGKAGIGTCGTWCPKLKDMAMRCHVYHCFVSISPTGGINDHDSHCGHAADQVAGGDCPPLVYQ